MPLERRATNGSQRKERMAAGGLAAPVSILANYIIFLLWGKNVSTEVAIAISSLVGSFVSVMTICFWDLRGLLLSWVRLTCLRRRKPR